MSKESNWISVSERLPEEGEFVICYFYPTHPIMEGRTIGLLRRIIFTSGHKDMFIRTDKNGFVNCSEVTHWQPLPKPPRS